MKSIGYASIILALGMGGCGYKTTTYHDLPPQFSNPVEEHAVFISPQFNLRQQGMVVEGFLQWEKSSSGYLHFNPIIQEADTLQPGDIRVLVSNQADCAKRLGSPCWGITYNSTRNVDAFASSVYLSLDLESDNEFQWMVNHEIGHSLLSLHMEFGTMMYPNYAGRDDLISCQDMKQFFDLRNVRNWTCDIFN